MGERIRIDSPEMGPEVASSPERDPALRRSTQAKLGRVALAGQRREETREAAARQLGRQTVQREARRSRD